MLTTLFLCPVMRSRKTCVVFTYVLLFTKTTFRKVNQTSGSASCGTISATTSAIRGVSNNTLLIHQSTRLASIRLHGIVPLLSPGTDNEKALRLYKRSPYAYRP